MAPSLKSFAGVLAALSLVDSIASVAVSFPADAYFSVTCNTDPILNTGVNPKDRWAAAKADLALVAAERNWNEVAGSQGTDVQLGFVNSMLNLWGQGDTVNCGLVDGSCDYSALQCGDSTKPGGVPHPGAWMIMKSLSHIHAYYLNIYHSFDDARSKLSNTMASFVDTFAPAKEETLLDSFFDGLAEAALNLILSEVLGPILGQLGAKIGEEIFDPIKDQIIESAQSAVSEGIASGALPEESQGQKQATLIETLQSIVNIHQVTLSSYVNNLLSGKVTELSKFHDTVSDGKWLIDALGSETLYDLSTIATKAFAALLVPEAWRTNNLQPIILMENTQCDPGNPLTLMNNDATHSGGSCAVAGKTFFLVGFSNAQCEYGSLGNYGGGNYACQTDVFQKLPGIDKLSTYGFDKDNIIRSVYAQYQLNGDRNGAPFNPASTAIDGAGNTGAFPFSAGFDTPGLFAGIPICEINEAANTWKNSPDAVKALCDYGT